MIFTEYLFLCVFLGLHLQHMEVPRIGIKSELQWPAYTTATEMTGLSRICDLSLCLRQRQILNPLSRARDQTHILMDNSQVLNPLSHDGNSKKNF